MCVTTQVPGADENLSITNSEIARRLRLSPELRDKPESVITDAIEEALESQRRLRMRDDAEAKMRDYRRVRARRQIDNHDTPRSCNLRSQHHVGLEICPSVLTESCTLLQGGAVETVLSPLEPENGGVLAQLALHPYTIIPGMQGSMQADYRK